MQELKIALVQMAPKLATPQENLYRMADYVKQIKSEQPVDLIVFPELITTGYECGVQFNDFAERTDGPTVNFLAQLASDHQVHIAFGSVTKAKVETIVYDSAILIDANGAMAGAYHKVHLRGEERLAFRAGFKFPVIETEFGMVGLALGWDLMFPEAIRSLALDGADLVLVLGNWEAKALAKWRVLNMARAIENAIFVAAANRVGEEPSYTFGGGSIVVSPWGEIVTTLEAPSEGYVVATLDLHEVRRAREALQLMQQREPANYRSLVRKY